MSRAGRGASAEGLFRPVASRRAFEDVLGQVVELIRSGQLNEGDDLPPERTLATVMAVSRPTVRQAIGALTDAGVVEVRQGRSGGVRVVSIWIPDGLAGELAEVQAEDTFALLEARRALEPRVAQLAALRGTYGEFDAMADCIEVQDANLDDRQKALQGEVLFHRLMWRAARNPALEELLRGLFDKLEPVLDMALRTYPDTGQAVDLHRVTLDALRTGDPAQVERAMDEHMAYMERIAEDVYGHKRIRELPAFLRGAGP